MQQPAWFERLLNTASLWWAAIRYPLGSLVAWVATVIGIIGGGAGLLAGITQEQSTQHLIWAVALAAIAIVSFGVFAVSHMWRSRAQAIANTIGQQALASDLLRETRNFLRIHAISKRQGHNVPADVLGRARQRIQDVLTAYADVFSSTVGARCRMCIKLIRIKPTMGDEIPAEDDFYIYALARDELSASENKRHDKKRNEEYLDALNANSDFLGLWSQDIADDGIFFSGDLRSEKGYLTSSVNYRRNIQKNPNRNDQTPWPLWYISTIVWPIRQENNDALGIEDYAQHGFLTVDSRARNAFDRETHVAMGRMLANALYPVLDLYTELLD